MILIISKKLKPSIKNIYLQVTEWSAFTSIANALNMTRYNKKNTLNFNASLNKRVHYILIFYITQDLARYQRYQKVIQYYRAHAFFLTGFCQPERWLSLSRNSVFIQKTSNQNKIAETKLKVRF